MSDYIDIDIVAMDVSYIVFAGIIVAGISALPLVLRGVYKLLKAFLQYKDKQDEKLHAQSVSEAKNELKTAVDSGSLSDLIDAANNLGNKKQEK